MTRSVRIAIGAGVVVVVGALATCGNCNMKDTGAYKYMYTHAFDLYADTLSDRSLLLYAVLAPKMKSGYDNVKASKVGISSKPRDSRDDAHSEQYKAQPLQLLPGGGYCARFPIRPDRHYSLVFWGGFRDVKLEDPKAKSITIYQVAELDSVPHPTAEIEQRLGAQCREKLGVAGRD